MQNDSGASGFLSLPGFELTEALTRAFAQDRIVEPTSVQRESFAPILEGRHVVLESATGTGKTLAYLLPLLQRLRQVAEGRTLVFAPATELALQILRVAERYKDPSLKTGALVASGNSRQQRARVQQSTRFITGTPGRILELYAERKLKGVTTIVLDEPEPIITSKDAQYLREVLSRPEPKVQLIFAAATFGVNAERWIAERMGPNVVRTRPSEDPLRDRISHGSLWARDETTKDRVLAEFIAEARSERAIVFVNQPHLLRHLYRSLNEYGLRTLSVSRERSKLECQQAMAAFSRSEARVLLTTDQAATGLDFPAVDWVFHYELPSSASAYVHRAGRTGRAGKSGHSIAIVGPAELGRLEQLGRALGIEFARLERR